MDQRYEDHPIAAIFPLLDGDGLSELTDSIRSQGLQDPVVIYEDKILDGRNRYRACLAAGVVPKITVFVGTPTEAIGFVWAKNKTRRHLSSSQAAIANAKMDRLLDLYAPVRAAAQERKSMGLTQQIVEGSPSRSERETDALRAKASGTNRTYINLADKLISERPDLAEKVERGESTLTQVRRAINEERREQRRQENARKAATTPAVDATIKYATLVVDPPWSFDDEGDVNQLGRAKQDYASMSFNELLVLPVGEWADEDSHIYLWITNRSLPKGFPLLEKWGFRYITALTWPKPSFGMGNYFRGQTEHVLFGVKGSQSLKRKDAPTILPTWSRGPNGHSSKPVEFYDFVESCSPGPYLEVFSRHQRDGWFAWGADAGV